MSPHENIRAHQANQIVSPRQILSFGDKSRQIKFCLYPQNSNFPRSQSNNPASCTYHCFSTSPWLVTFDSVPRRGRPASGGWGGRTLGNVLQTPQACASGCICISIGTNLYAVLRTRHHYRQLGNIGADAEPLPSVAGGLD